MALPSKAFQQLVDDMVLAWQNEIGLVPQLQEGDLLLAIFEAFSSQLLFLQGLVQLVNNIARAQTSSGADLDTFMAQFNFFRLPATFLIGTETFQRVGGTTTQIIVRPITTIVQTPGGAIQYQVIEDDSQAAWSPGRNAYVMPIGQSSIDVTVKALVAGTSYAVTAGQLSQLATAIAGINTVTNNADINNASPTETDDAFRARFVLYLGSLSKATKAALLYALHSVQTGLSINPLENENPDGDEQLGSFTMVVDDGTGFPPDSLISSCFKAVNSTRGFTIQPYVVAPTVTHPEIVLNIRPTAQYSTSVAGFTPADAENNALLAVLGYINSIEPGADVIGISLIEQAALQGPGVALVEPGATTIGGLNQDKVLTEFQCPRITASAVTVGAY